MGLRKAATLLATGLAAAQVRPPAGRYPQSGVPTARYRSRGLFWCSVFRNQLTRQSFLFVGRAGLASSAGITSPPSALGVITPERPQTKTSYTIDDSTCSPSKCRNLDGIAGLSGGASRVAAY
jgi:hypothetical protein